MSTLVFDIETVGETWSEIDTYTQDSLCRRIKKVARTETEEKKLKEEVKNSLGLSPFTGEIVSFGLYDVERAQGVVYFQSTEKDVEFAVGDIIFRTRNEKEMLKDFWEGAHSYDTFVTFAGRMFDVPFISIRSAAHGIRPTCDLMQHRYLKGQEVPFHIDLQEQLSYYGAVQKRPSLHLSCRALGIDSPKEDGVDGSHVSELYRSGRFRKIAQYNARDLTATTALYSKWLQYLAPHSFLNRIV